MNTRTTQQILDQDFLSARSAMLEIASFLDQLRQSNPDVRQMDEPRLKALYKCLPTLSDDLLMITTHTHTQDILEILSDASTLPTDTPPTPKVTGASQ